MADAEKVPDSVLLQQPPDGIFSEDQLEAVLWGFFYRVSRGSDRGATWGGDVNWETGQPNSANALLPRSRAKWGAELALSLVIPPEGFVCTLIATDDVPQNASLAPDSDQREWVSMAFKPKYVAGPNGRAVSDYLCRECDESWRKEASAGKEPPCPKCGCSDHRALEVVAVDNWSEDEVRAVRENTFRLKRVVHQLEKQGYFLTRPQVAESGNELGVTHLDWGEDRMTMGFQITYLGLKRAEEWVKKHPRWEKGQTLFDALGKTLATKAPDWLKREQAREAGN